MDPIIFHWDYFSAVLTWPRTSTKNRDALLVAITEALYGMSGAAFFTPAGRPGRRFAELWNGPDGINVGYTKPTVEQNHRLYLEMKGEAFQTISHCAIYRLLEWCRLNGVLCLPTRVDLAWDHVPFTVAQAVHACEDGNIRTRAHRRREIMSRELGRRDPAAAKHPDDGTTCMIGKTISPRSCRIYDKHGFTRVELQLREERANAAVYALTYTNIERALARTDDHEATARALLVDFVDFIDATESANISRCARLDWWDAFIAGVVRLRHVFARTRQKIENIERWIHRTVLPTLATLKLAIGATGKNAAEWLRDAIDEGSRRMTPYQMQLVINEYPRRI